MDLKLDGKVALVTGASRGIGMGAARILAAEGCRVAICARRENLLSDFADGIEAAGHARPLLVVEDVLPRDAGLRIRDKVLGEFGRCDILINSAGGSRSIPWDSPDEVWDEGMVLNFDAVRRLTNAIVPSMIEHGYGRVMTMTGIMEPPGVNVAIAAKAAIHTWSKGMSRVHAKAGITFNCLPPGRIKSEQIMERLHADPEARQRYIDENIPVGYFGEPEDMGYLIAFLASPLARYITGEIIHVDGGMHRYAF
jgi:3-oxoacyl-[acyl-carrier protein] reductase